MQPVLAMMCLPVGLFYCVSLLVYGATAAHLRAPSMADMEDVGDSAVSVQLW